MEKMETTMTHTDLASLLDLTHAFDGRGPKTYNARQRIATYLDTHTDYDHVTSSKIRRDARWLRHVVRFEDARREA